MDKINDMELRLWEYIDGFTEASERPVIEQLIAEHREWKEKYAELLALHQSINLTELEEPSMRFTRNVMEEIAKYQVAPAAKKYINNKVIWGIVAFFLVLIVGFLGYGFGQIDWTAASDAKSSLGIDFSKVNYNKIFDNSFVNMFMMMNVVLGLVLLDRYLSVRKKQWTK